MRDALDVFSPDVDGFVEDGDGLQFGDGRKRGPEVGLIALRLGWRHRDIDMEPGLFGGLEGPPLGWPAPGS